MSEIVLFHHAQGLTAGCRDFADALRADGHVVHTPDLYDGRTFEDLSDGITYAEQIGFGTVLERGARAVEALPEQLVYAGFSLGVLPAQQLAQTRPGAQGAVFMHSCVPLEEFGGEWPAGLPLQIHTREADDWGDADIAKAVAAAVPSAELFLYPGDQHLFTDSSLPAYDPAAAAQVMQRVRAFLATG